MIKHTLAVILLIPIQPYVRFAYSKAIIIIMPIIVVYLICFADIMIKLPLEVIGNCCLWLGGVTQ